MRDIFFQTVLQTWVACLGSIYLPRMCRVGVEAVSLLTPLSSDKSSLSAGGVSVVVPCTNRLMFCCKSKMKCPNQKCPCETNNNGKWKVKLLIGLLPHFISWRNPSIRNTFHVEERYPLAVIPKQVTAWCYYHEDTYSVTSFWPLSGTDIHRIICLPQTKTQMLKALSA